MNNQGTHTSQEIHYTKEFKRKLLIQRILEIVFWVFILIIAAYVSFIMFKAPIKTTNGTLYPSNKVPDTNSTVVVLPENDNIIGRLENGIISHDVQEGKVIVGNYGTILNINGNVAINKDGKTIRTNIKYDNTTKKYLDNEYIVKLNSGKELLLSGDKIKATE